MNSLARKAFQPTVLLNVIAPLLGYYLLHALGSSDLVALSISAAFPAAAVALAAYRKRRLEAIGMVSLAFIVISVATAAVFQDPRLLLVMSAVPTGLIGLGFLATLLMRRPMLYVLGRQLEPVGLAGTPRSFDGRWATSAEFRQRLRTLTAAWGAALAANCVIHIALALLLEPSLVVMLNPLVMVATIGPLAIHTMRGRAQRVAAAATA
ncbi:VC0807 family protein [Pseudonocardia sp. GCM10023141]|uniref:VC0807 family protein n=1 Tax=Pseudonocardia sp. GCM10023141 TaxID=3252653 RepID=UPI00360BF3DA